VAALEAAVKRDGMTVLGSAGQSRLNPAVTELRQARLALARLLGELSLPDEEDKRRSAASRRGQRAVRSRWDMQRARRGSA
jgi:hypothetical protein